MSGGVGGGVNDEDTVCVQCRDRYGCVKEGGRGGGRGGDVYVSWMSGVDEVRKSLESRRQYVSPARGLFLSLLKERHKKDR